jgi:uncharacterized protein YceH (UPF0502 family)
MLSHAEIRVLGCLVEKQLATPQAYPLTEAAVLTACSQSTNRDPVVAYDTSTVRRALIGLRQHGLAKEVHRPGERAAKHRHLLDEALELAVPDTAVLAVLALRGPQTAAELRARTERLHPFASVAEVEAVLERLAGHAAGPLSELQPRRPGQKEARWAHLLLDPDAEDAGAGGAADAGAPGAADGPVGGPRVSLIQLAEEVAALREEVARLRGEVAQLRERA